MPLARKIYFVILVFLGFTGLMFFLVKMADATVQMTAGTSEVDAAQTPGVPSLSMNLISLTPVVSRTASWAGSRSTTTRARRGRKIISNFTTTAGNSLRWVGSIASAFNASAWTAHCLRIATTCAAYLLQWSTA